MYFRDVKLRHVIIVILELSLGSVVFICFLMTVEKYLI